MSIRGNVQLTLRARLIVLMSALIGTVTVLAALYVPRWLQTEAMTSATAKGKAIAAVTAYSVSPALLFDDRKAAADAIGGACRGEEVMSIVVRDSDGRTFASCRRPSDAADPSMVIAVPVKDNARLLGDLVLTLSLRDVEGRIDANRRRIALIATIVGAIGILAVVAISSVVLAPLRKISEVADGVRAGNTALRAGIVANDEVGRMARAFNHMLDSLERAQIETEHLNRTLELKVAQRTRELSEVLDTAYDGILVVDADGLCTMCNPSAAKTLRVNPSDLLGHDLHAILHAGNLCPQSDCELATVLGQRSKAWTRTKFRCHGTDELLSVEISSVSILDDVTGNVRWVLTFRDVTDREHLQEQLDRANRLSSLGQLAAMLAHEFNNVLMTIGPFVEIIRRAPHDGSAVQRACGVIDQAVVRGKRVTQDVLRYTRPAPPNITEFDSVHWLNTWVADARVTHPDSIRIEARTPSVPRFIAADRSQIEQVLSNLVSNAGDAMSRNGTVRISIDSVPEDVSPEWVEITISDTGSGMDKATAARIFEPFYTTKKVGGTGLGLAVVEQIVSRNGGQIRLDTSPGQGTTFHIRLPAGQDPRSESVPVAGSSVRGTLPETLLLVEDDEAVSAGLVELLQQEGITVSVASSGEQALAALKFFTPQAVVLDIGLPDMDGLEVYKSFAERLLRVPVIFSTGHGDARRLDDILELGNVDFLLKPYELDSLLSKLTALMTAAAGGAIAPDLREG